MVNILQQAQRKAPIDTPRPKTTLFTQKPLTRPAQSNTPQQKQKEKRV
jgi:hypothetical protein